MPNVENINLMIEAIRKEKQPIKMASFVQRNEACGTTACLAGWANLLSHNLKGNGLTEYNEYRWNEEQGRGLVSNKGLPYISLDNTSHAAQWMGISDAQASHLFYFTGIDYSADHEARKAIAIRVLETLRDQGDVRWDDVIRDMGL